MKEAVKDITGNLTKMAIPVTTFEQVKQVATISTENEELGNLIGDVVYKLGKDCNVLYETRKLLELAR